MRRDQFVKMIVGLLILGVFLYFALSFYFNMEMSEPANIIVNMVGYKTNNITITLPKVSGDNKIIDIIEKENDKWRQKAESREIATLNVTITYYDDYYISLFYSATDENKNKEIDSLVIDLRKRAVLGKGDIVDIVIKSKFEAEGREDPKMNYPDATFSQFDEIYLEKGTDGTINGVFYWKNSNTQKYTSSKLNGFEVIKSIV